MQMKDLLHQMNSMQNDCLAFLRSELWLLTSLRYNFKAEGLTFVSLIERFFKIL